MPTKIQFMFHKKKYQKQEHFKHSDLRISGKNSTNPEADLYSRLHFYYLSYAAVESANREHCIYRTATGCEDKTWR